MNHDEPLAIFIASDANIEDALPFLAALRRCEPRLRLRLLPAEPACADLRSFGPVYNFDVLAYDFAAIDLLERIRFGGAAASRGRLRLLAAFDIAAPAVAWLDLSTRSDGVSRLLARLAVATVPTVALQPASAPASATALLAIGGPPVGAARVVRALRENLVSSMAEPASYAGDLVRAVESCGIHRTTTAEVAWQTWDPRPPRRDIAALRDCGGVLTVLDNGGSYRRRPGRIVGAPDRLAAAHDIEAHKAVIEPPPALVARLQHATVHGRGIIITDMGLVVQESLINVDMAAFHDGLRARPVECRDVAGPVVLLKQTWDNNYGHWLIESLPRVGLVAECNDLAECRFLVAAEAGPMGQVYRDSLRLLGIGDDQIIVSSDATRFCADLIYPAPLTAQPWVKAPRALQFLESLAAGLPNGEAGPRKLYVSRNATGRRMLRNEAAILDRLAGRGYVTIAPEQLDFETQIRMFRHVTYVVGNLGAGLANLAFAPRGVQLLALTTEFMQDDFFWDLVSQRGGHYVSLHGVATDPAAGMNSDFHVDIEQFSQLLDSFEQQ